MVTNSYCYRSAQDHYYSQSSLTAITPPHSQPFENDEYQFLTNFEDINKDITLLLSPPHTPPAKHQSQCFNQLNKLLNRTQNRISVIMKVENHQIKRISDELIHSDLDEFICKWENCYCKFLKLEDLGYHMQKHAVIGLAGLYYCKWEGCVRQERGFNARYKMLVHVRTHTKEKPHQCPECEKCFSRAENLKIHMRSHSGEKPYVCPVEGCNKAYSNSSDRFKHTRTHSNDKPYMCKVPGCQKRYTDPSSLRKHVKTYKHNELQLSNQNTSLLHGGFTSDESNKSCDYDCPGDSDDNNLIIDVVSIDQRDKEDFLYHQHPHQYHQGQNFSSSPYEQFAYSENYFGILHPSAVLHNFKFNSANVSRNFLQNSTNFMKMYDEKSFPRETIKFENMEIDVPLDLRMHHR